MQLISFVGANMNLHSWYFGPHLTRSVTLPPVEIQKVLVEVRKSEQLSTLAKVRVDGAFYSGSQPLGSNQTVCLFPVIAIKYSIFNSMQLSRTVKNFWGVYGIEFNVNVQGA